MNDDQLRALIGVLLYHADRTTKRTGIKPMSLEEYIASGQIWLEQSYQNYKHPAGPNRDQRDVDNAIALLTLKGYQITYPSDASTPPQP